MLPIARPEHAALWECSNIERSELQAGLEAADHYACRYLLGYWLRVAAMLKRSCLCGLLGPGLHSTGQHCAVSLSRIAEVLAMVDTAQRSRILLDTRPSEPSTQADRLLPCLPSLKSYTAYGALDKGTCRWGRADVPRIRKHKAEGFELARTLPDTTWRSADR